MKRGTFLSSNVTTLLRSQVMNVEGLQRLWRQTYVFLKTWKVLIAMSQRQVNKKTMYKWLPATIKQSWYDWKKVNWETFHTSRSFVEVLCLNAELWLHVAPQWIQPSVWLTWTAYVFQNCTSVYLEKYWNALSNCPPWYAQHNPFVWVYFRIC